MTNITNPYRSPHPDEFTISKSALQKLINVTQDMISLGARLTPGQYNRAREAESILTFILSGGKAGIPHPSTTDKEETS